MTHSSLPVRQKPRTIALACALLAGIVLGLCACETRAPDPANAASWDSEWSREVEVVRGEDASDEFFGEIVDAVIAPPLGVIVVDAANKNLRRVSLDGRFLGTFGREGSGPGEFQNPRRIVYVPPDTFWVLDPGKLAMDQLRWDATGPSAIRTTRLQFWPANACLLENKLYVLGAWNGSVLHQVGSDGVVNASYGAQSTGDSDSEDPLAAIRRDELAGGALACDETSMAILHVPGQLGIYRIYHIDTGSFTEYAIPNFVQPKRVVTAGGIRVDFNEKYGYADWVAGAVMIGADSALIEIRRDYPRNSGREARLTGAIVDMKDGKLVATDIPIPRLIAVSNNLAVGMGSEDLEPALVIWRRR